MLDTNDMSDDTDDLSALFEGSVSNEGSAATMATLTPEPNFGVDDAGNNQQDWQEFHGDINDLLSSHPPTYLKQSKHKKASQASVSTKYEYRTCHCGCTYKLSIHVMSDVSSGIDLIHYKEVMVSGNVMSLYL
jgi:hypothetical protein